MDYINWKLNESNKNNWDYNGARKNTILLELFEAREECKKEGDIENMKKYQELITKYVFGKIQ